MNEILCPHCKKAFKVDEAGFADILKQVRDQEFEKELLERVQIANREKENAVKLAEANIRNELQADVSIKETRIAELKAERDAEIARLEAQRKADILELQADKDAELTRLHARLESAETEKKLALSEAVTKLEKERDQIANDLRSKDAEQR